MSAANPWSPHPLSRWSSRGRIWRALLILTTASSTLAQEEPRPAEQDLFGQSVAAVGDVDRDGVPDLLVGSPDDLKSVPGENGRAFVLSGKDGAVIHELGPVDCAGFGITVTGPGDLDGDGVPDLLVGAGGMTDLELSHVFGYSGKTGERLYTIDLPEDRAKLCWNGLLAGPAMCGLGDVNGDGQSDFAVGSAHDDLEGADSGTVRVFSGADASIVFSFAGRTSYDRLGTSVAAAGDLDGDGVNDLLAGAIPVYGAKSEIEALRTIRPGYVVVLSGKDGAVLRTIRSPDGSPHFGTAVARCEDRNADGRPEILVGQASFGELEGKIQVFSGADGSLQREWGEWSGVGLRGAGTVLCGMPDVDGDGTPELFVSMPFGLSSVAYVLSGAGDRVIHELEAWSPTGGWPICFGVSACPVGDLDGDGLPELAVGAASWRGGIGGVVAVYSGKSGKPIKGFTRETLR